FLPGGAKYGDLPGLLALSAPHTTCLIGETPESVQLASALYRKAGGTLGFIDSKKTPAELVEWILAP
ncbi:MAG: hypothetical protein V4710_12085, partial [Verrucomicrobiota bacterium]